MHGLTYIAMLLAAAVALAACAPVPQGAVARTWGGPATPAQFTARTDVLTQTHTVKASAQEVACVIESELTAGAIAWVLQDPTGRVRWSEQVVAPAWVQRGRTFEPQPGVWKLKVALADATGSYQARCETP